MNIKTPAQAELERGTLRSWYMDAKPWLSHGLQSVVHNNGLQQSRLQEDDLSPLTTPEGTRGCPLGCPVQALLGRGFPKERRLSWRTLRLKAFSCS